MKLRKWRRTKATTLKSCTPSETATGSHGSRRDSSRGAQLKAHSPQQSFPQLELPQPINGHRPAVSMEGTEHLPDKDPPPSALSRLAMSTEEENTARGIQAQPEPLNPGATSTSQAAGADDQRRPLKAKKPILCSFDVGSGSARSSRPAKAARVVSNAHEEVRRLRTRKEVEYNVNKIIHKVFYEKDEGFDESSYRPVVRATRAAAASNTRLEPRQSRAARFQTYMESLGEYIHAASGSVRRTRHSFKKGREDGSEAGDDLQEAIEDDDMDAVFACLDEGHFIGDSHIAEAVRGEASSEVLELLLCGLSSERQRHDHEGK